MVDFQQAPEISIEIKQENKQYYATLLQGGKLIKRSDCFNTQAGASLAGKILIDKNFKPLRFSYLFK